MCFVEERLHALLEVFSLLARPHRAAQTTTGSAKKAHAFHVPTDNGVRALARIGADGGPPEDMMMDDVCGRWEAVRTSSVVAARQATAWNFYSIYTIFTLIPPGIKRIY